MSEFRDKAIAGVSWSVAGQAARQVLGLVAGIVLARLLSPEVFGLVAMITVITGFAHVFADLGFGAALIQKEDLRPEHLSSVFWLNVACGGLLSVLFMLGAPLIGAFYEEPLLVPLTVALATTFFISSLGIVQRTIFTRAIDFRVLSMAEVGAVALSGAVAIGMAYNGWGVWSLAAQQIINAAALTGLLWVLSPWRPRLAFRWAAVRDLLGFSANLLGEQTLNYWVRNLDDLLIGRVIGSASLGVYNRAYAIMLFPLQNVSRVIARVMFPSLSTIQQDKPRVKDVFLKMTRTIALLSFPLMCGLLATTEAFVLAVFGPQWSAMIPILRVLCVVGLAQSIVTLVGSLFLSQGRADLQFRLGLFTKPLLVTGIVVGLQRGVLGVAVGYALAVGVSQYLNLRFAGALVGLTYAELLKNLAGVFACAAAMAGLVFGLGLLLPPAWPSWAALAVQVPFGVVVYAALVHGFGVAAYREARRLLAEQWTRTRQAPSAS